MQTELQPKGTGEHIICIPVKTFRANKIHTDIVVIDKEDLSFFAKYKWSVDKDKKVVCTINNEDERFLSRILLKPNEFDYVDHIDRNTLNNSKRNLRICSSQENNRNRIANSNSSSKYKGVHFCSTKNRWIARIRENYKIIHLGTFKNEEDAAKAYDKKARIMHKDFGRYNFPVNNERSAI